MIPKIMLWFKSPNPRISDYNDISGLFMFYLLKHFLIHHNSIILLRGKRK